MRPSERLRTPCSTIRLARVDQHLALKPGFAEVVFDRKSPEQVAAISESLPRRHDVLATRVSTPGRPTALPATDHHEPGPR